MKMTNLDVEQPTALQCALTGYDLACTELDDHKARMAALRTRIAELAGALAETREKSGQKPCMAALSLEEIKKLSAQQSAWFQELSGLQAAHDYAVKELRDAERDQEGLRLVKVDTAQYVWGVLYADLLKAIDRPSLERLVTAGYLARIPKDSIVNDLIGLDAELNAGIATALSEQFATPL